MQLVDTLTHKSVLGALELMATSPRGKSAGTLPITVATLVSLGSSKQYFAQLSWESFAHVLYHRPSYNTLIICHSI